MIPTRNHLARPVSALAVPGLGVAATASRTGRP